MWSAVLKGLKPCFSTFLACILEKVGRVRRAYASFYTFVDPPLLANRDSDVVYSSR